MSDDKAKQGCGWLGCKVSTKVEKTTSQKLKAGTALPHVTLPTTEVRIAYTLLNMQGGMEGSSLPLPSTSVDT